MTLARIKPPSRTGGRRRQISSQARQPDAAPYNPRKDGAQCDKCPLKDSTPVRAALPKRPKLSIVGEAPGRNEELEGTPFIGASGTRLDAGCVAFGIDRSRHLHITNAVLCRPSRKLTPDEWREAMAACRPRLDKELAKAKTPWALLLGKQSLYQMNGVTDHMKNWSGAVWTSTFDPGLQTLATYHPAFAMRGRPQYFPVFYTHLERAWRYATEQDKPLRWPTIHWKPGPRQLNALERLLDNCKRLTVDVETAGPNPEAPLTAFGFGSTKLGVSVPWPPKRFYSDPREASRCLSLIKRIAAHPGIKKIAHNGIYDLTALACEGIPVQGYDSDTILKHQVVAPTLPHGLQFAALLEFGAEPWKTVYHVLGDEKGSTRFLKALEKPGERKALCVYNAKDCISDSILDRALDRRLKETHRGFEQFEGYLARSLVSLHMRNDGAQINVSVLKDHDRILSGRWKAARRQLRKIAGAVGHTAESEKALAEVARKNLAKKANAKRRSKRQKKLHRPKLIKVGFNPASSKHLHELFFERLGCRPLRYSMQTGLPSLDNKVIRHYLVDARPAVRTSAQTLVRFRRWQKLLRTYVQRLVYDEHGIIHADAKVWGAHTGRWSYGSKSCPFSPQTIPKPKFRQAKRLDPITKKPRKILVAPGLRDIIGVRPGNWLCEADYSQLEARIIAFLANDQKLLAVFERGEDLHNWTAAQLFGPHYDKSQRDMAKRARYAWQYGAEPSTAWLSLVVDAPGLLLADVERLWRRLALIHPYIVQWQKRSVRAARISDFVEAPISGRRFYFHGEVEPAKVYNLPVQGTGADLIDAAVVPVWEDLRKTGRKREYLLFQVHDALLTEGPNPVRLCQILKKHMDQTLALEDGRTCRFPIDFKISPYNWGECREFSTVAEVRRIYTEYKKHGEQVWPTFR